MQQLLQFCVIKISKVDIFLIYLSLFFTIIQPVKILLTLFENYTLWCIYSIRGHVVM